MLATQALLPYDIRNCSLRSQSAGSSGHTAQRRGCTLSLAAPEMLPATYNCAARHLRDTWPTALLQTRLRALATFRCGRCQSPYCCERLPRSLTAARRWMPTCYRQDRQPGTPFATQHFPLAAAQRAICIRSSLLSAAASLMGTAQDLNCRQLTGTPGSAAMLRYYDPSPCRLRGALRHAQAQWLLQ